MVPGQPGQILVFAFFAFHAIACGDLLPHRTVGGLNGFHPAIQGVSAQGILPYTQGCGVAENEGEQFFFILWTAQDG